MLAFSFTGFDELNKIYVEAELRIQNWTIIRLLRTHSMMLLILFTKYQQILCQSLKQYWRSNYSDCLSTKNPIFGKYSSLLYH